MSDGPRRAVSLSNQKDRIMCFQTCINNYQEDLREMSKQMVDILQQENKRSNQDMFGEMVGHKIN